MAKRYKASNRAEGRLVATLDNLTEYESFLQDVLPALRKDIKDHKLSTEDLAQRYSKYALAKILTIAFTETDSGKATVAAKEVLDRSLGKPVQSTVSEHRFSKMSDDDLDALLVSKVKTVSETSLLENDDDHDDEK